MRDVSIIIPAFMEKANVFSTVNSILRNGSERLKEIIIVNDGNTHDYSSLEEIKDPVIKVLNTERLGLAKAKNFGASCSTGDTLIFLDAHMELSESWIDKLSNTLNSTNAGIVIPAIYDTRNKESIGFGQTIGTWRLEINWLPKKGENPYEVPLAGGACMAINKKIFHEFGGFDSGLIDWGFEDTELSIRIWFFGRKIIIDPDVSIGHLFRDAFVYPINLETIDTNLLRTAFLHFNSSRIKKVIGTVEDREHFPSCYARILSDDTIEKRKNLSSKRIFSDDWFFEKFDIQI